MVKDGAHTHGTDGVGGLAVVVIAALLLGSGVASAVAHAIVTIMIVLGCTVALTAAGCIAWIIWQLRQDRPRQAMAAPAVVQLPPATAQRLEAAQPLAIEPPRNELHLHFHGMTPAEAAEAIRQAGERR